MLFSTSRDTKERVDGNHMSNRASAIPSPFSKSSSSIYTYNLSTRLGVGAGPKATSTTRKMRSAAVRGDEVAKWGVEEVAEWLRGLELAHHAAAFQNAGVDGPTLLQLTTQDLSEQFGAVLPGFSGWIAAKKIAGHINIFKLHLGQDAQMAELEASAFSLRGGVPPPDYSLRQDHKRRPATADDYKKASYSTTASSGSSMRSLGAARRDSRPRTSHAASMSQLSIDPLDRSEMLHTQRSTSFLAEQMSTFDTRKKSQKGSMSMARRNVSESLFLKGASSPGVGRYEALVPDSARRRGGAMGRAPRFDSAKRRPVLASERPPPGPQSYVPNFLAKSRGR